MPNTHLEHPEELILTGETWVLDALANPQNVSLKIDGAPAVIWGFHPHNGRFFVGTKSVFNKVKIKIAYTQSDVVQFYGHSSNLVRILSACLDALPRVPGIFQGDFIGFGGSDTYTPNTLTYVFPEVITKSVIIAPHTTYTIPGRMCDAMPSPLRQAMPECDGVHWVEPIVDFLPGSVPSLDTSEVAWLSPGQVATTKIEINRMLREGASVRFSSVVENNTLAALADAVYALKESVLERAVVTNCPKTYLDGQLLPTGEGLVLYHDRGALKVVRRQQFSAANFTQGRFQR